MNVKETASRAAVEEVVRSLGRVRLRVLGTSMAPSVLPGDLVSIQRADLNEISLGEIVLFTQDERLFVHRVVSRLAEGEAPGLITRGDRLDYDDPPVTSSDILGRVTSVVRGRRCFQPGAEVKGWNRLLLGVLRSSDLATFAYLRVVSRLEEVFARKGESRP
jgi:signal peptidase I